MDLHLLLPLTLVPAILVGQLCKRIGLPAVVGQILTGVILGPLLLGVIEAEPESLPDSEQSKASIYQLAEIGLCILLFKIGFETRFSDFTRVWNQALNLAGYGIFIPLFLGFGTAFLLGWSPLSSMFLGAALTATSIGVTASVIDETGLKGSPESDLILGAAVVDDIVGLVFLSILTTFALGSGSILVATGKSLGFAVSFLVAAIVFGRLIVRLFERAANWFKSELILTAFAFGYLLVMAYVAHSIGLAAIIGSYAAGLVFSSHDEPILERAFKPLTELFSPLFFILVGSSISFNGEFTWSLAAIILALLSIAIASKFLAAWILPASVGDRNLIGAGIVPRGEVGLVFASVGLSSGAFSTEQYAPLTLVIVITTVIGPLLFRFFVRSKTKRQIQPE